MAMSGQPIGTDPRQLCQQKPIELDGFRVRLGIDASECRCRSITFQNWQDCGMLPLRIPHANQLQSLLKKNTFRPPPPRPPWTQLQTLDVSTSFATYSRSLNQIPTYDFTKTTPPLRRIPTPMNLFLLAVFCIFHIAFLILPCSSHLLPLNHAFRKSQ